MILFKDFVPEQVATGKFFGSTHQYEAFEDVVARANDWITTSNRNVLNVETVVLPNIHAQGGSAAPELRNSGEVLSTWHQFVRVWYYAE